VQNENLWCSEGVDVPAIDDHRHFGLKRQRILDVWARNSGWQKELKLLAEQEPELTTGSDISS